MPFKKGHEKIGGRPKGSPNKRSFLAEEIAKRHDVDPFEVMIQIAANDWQGLGYDKPTKTEWLQAGIEVEEDRIKLSDRLHAAKEASKYLYTQKKSIELEGGQKPIEIVIKDYSK
jgi:hypothetical protein